MKLNDKIKKIMRDNVFAFKETFSSTKYILIALGFSFIIYSFSVLITNYELLNNIFSFKLLFALLGGSFSSMELWGVSVLIFTSLLAGLVFSMSIFIIRRQIKFNAGLGGSSVLVSVIAPSCPSCAMGLLTALGIGGFLSFLPFRGGEIGILSIILLTGTIMYLSKKITTVVCEVRS